MLIHTQPLQYLKDTLSHNNISAVVGGHKVGMEYLCLVGVHLAVLPPFPCVTCNVLGHTCLWLGTIQVSLFELFDTPQLGGVVLCVGRAGP